MLHPQATELLVYAKSVGCKIGLITNGSLFDEASSRAFLDAGVDMIEFSVDACEPQTYAIVRKGLEWDVLVENARRMLSMRNERRSSSKVVASAVVQSGVDIDREAQSARVRPLLHQRNAGIHDSARIDVIFQVEIKFPSVHLR